MSLRIERAIGRLLILDGYDPNECYPDSYGELKKDLAATMPVGLPDNPELGFVVYGFATPSEESKGRLWVNMGRNNEFTSMFYFANGAWVDFLQWQKRVHELIGDSNNPPLGYTALNGSAANLPNLSGQFVGTPPAQIYKAIWTGVPVT